MPEEEQEVLDVEASDSSTEETDVDQTDSSTVEPEEATSPKEAVQNTVPYDRFKEVIDEKNQYLELIKTMSQRQQTGETPKQVEQDPYAGMDAETAQFYRNLDQRTQSMIQREAEKLSKPLVQQTEYLKSQLARIQEKEFRTTNKDVEPNSREEKEIAHLISAGLDPEKAAWAVMGPKRIEMAKTESAKKKDIKIKQKAEANLETGIAPQSGVPKGQNMSFRDKLEANARKLGIAL